MEDNIQKNNNKKFLGILLSVIAGALIFIVILAIWISNQNAELKKREERINTIATEMVITNGALSKQTNKADSLNHILAKFSKYMPFANTLEYRDSVCSKLPYTTGDVVLMKPDSSRWVIITVSIKGGKWQHTVSYIVRDSAGKQMEVEPETLY